MPAITNRELMREGMTTDQITGFRMMVANPCTPTGGEEDLAPRHLSGTRLDAFLEGVDVGRRWNALRRAAGRRRRRERAEGVAAEDAPPPREALRHLWAAMGRSPM